MRLTETWYTVVPRSPARSYLFIGERRNKACSGYGGSVARIRYRQRADVSIHVKIEGGTRTRREHGTAGRAHESPTRANTDLKFKHSKNKKINAGEFYLAINTIHYHHPGRTKADAKRITILQR